MMPIHVVSADGPVSVVPEFDADCGPVAVLAVGTYGTPEEAVLALMDRHGRFRTLVAVLELAGFPDEVITAVLDAGEDREVARAEAALARAVLGPPDGDDDDSDDDDSDDDDSDDDDPDRTPVEGGRGAPFSAGAFWVVLAFYVALLVLLAARG